MVKTFIPYITLKGERHEFRHPEVMGILNVTPDSFYAASRKQTEKEIIERAIQITEEGATMIDVGACSTRPGGEVASAEEEMTRMRYALQTIRREMPYAILSIDTFRPEVAKMSVEEFGADIINDVSEGSDEMFRLVGQLNVAYILMSLKSGIKEMAEAFSAETAKLKEAGCNDIILDPGYGFGKDICQNYKVLNSQENLLDMKMPILAGVSRKRMIWQLLGTSPAEALNGTSIVNTLALLHGADILRVHDVKEAAEAIKITEACF